MNRFMLVRAVPVKPWNFSVLDQEFDSVRDKFLQDMKKMEDEMSRFHRECSIFDNPKPDPAGDALTTLNSILAQCL
ncbi:hypothetical protein Pmani_033919 [Petrolisthes manimaculis]|uniref:Uncharacterized protein n=1 Tax=Petrolisthes manimaculis TaxID=1843537 RepID=A0AAE1TQ78_9EUCA|nr:hypothetical protein Pmani_033919 [Petrolisthes manimaculis]